MITEVVYQCWLLSTQLQNCRDQDKWDRAATDHPWRVGDCNTHLSLSLEPTSELSQGLSLIPGVWIYPQEPASSIPLEPDVQSEESERDNKVTEAAQAWLEPVGETPVHW